MAEYKLLPAFCKPYEDELLSSWLTRMAFDHGLGTKDFCDQIWLRYTNLDIDRLISKENLQALAEQTGCSFEQVLATTLAGYENHIFTSPADHVMDNWVLANNHQTRTWGPGLLYCPKCLIIKPYFKKQWRLAISFVCTECNCYLNECCPHSLYDSAILAKDALKNNENLKQRICEDFRVKHKDKPEKVLFTLQQNDLVYLPENTGDLVLNLDRNEFKTWLNDIENKKKFSKRVYKVVMFTGTDCKFIPHNYANAIAISKDLTEEQKELLKNKHEGKKGIPKNELNFVEFGSY